MQDSPSLLTFEASKNPYAQKAFLENLYKQKSRPTRVGVGVGGNALNDFYGPTSYGGGGGSSLGVKSKVQTPTRRTPTIPISKGETVKPYVGNGMFGGKPAGPSWQERMAQQYGSKGPGFGAQPQSSYQQQAAIAERAAAERRMMRGLSHQPWKNPKTPLSSPMKGPPPGMKPGIIGASVSGGGAVIGRAAGVIGRAASVLGKISGIITAFQIGWEISNFANQIDPEGSKFLKNYFGGEVDKPATTNEPIESEIGEPIPQDPRKPIDLPIPEPIPPAPPPGSIPNAEWLLLEITRSGSQQGADAFDSYLAYSRRFEDNSFERVNDDINDTSKIWVLTNRNNLQQQTYTTVREIPITRLGVELTYWDSSIINYIFVLGTGDYVEGFNFPRNRVIYQTPGRLELGGSTSGTDWAFDYIYTPNPEYPNPLDPFERPFIITTTDPYPYVCIGGHLFISIRVLNEPQKPWTPPDTWKQPQPEDDMACDLSPIMQQLQQQRGQITTLQNTVNNISLNSSSIQNINANTTTVVNNAISSINSNTSSVVTSATNAINTNTVSAVNTATNAINTNTVSAVNTATNAINTNTVSAVNTAASAINTNTVSTVNTAANAINSNTVSTVNTAANAINSNIANLSSKLTSVADDIVLNIKNGFTALEAALKPALNKIDEMVSSLSEAFKKFSERFDKFLKWIHFDRVLNLLILITTIHNAAMLSNQLAASLTSMINSLLTAGGNALGLRGVDDEPIDIGPAVSGAFSNFVAGFIGKENSAELKKQWNKYNRIYQAAANLLGSIQSLNQSIISALEIVGGNVARIGNALKKWGEVSESAFNWMNPQPFFSNPFSRFAEKSQQGVETTDQVAQEVISSQQQVSQIQKEIDDFKELLDKEEKTGIPAPTPAKTTATETEAKTNSTAGATPLLISEKQ